MYTYIDDAFVEKTLVIFQTLPFSVPTCSRLSESITLAQVKKLKHRQTINIALKFHINSYLEKIGCIRIFNVFRDQDF